MIRYPRTPQEKLAMACRIVAAEGHNDAIWGHISLRELEGKEFWMKPAEMGLEEVKPADLIRVALDGKKVRGKGKCHVEWPIHAEVFRARPDVTTVIHTHPLHSTLLGATGKRIRPLTHEGALFFPPDLPLFDLTTTLIVTRELGEAVAKSLGEGSALLLKNHGIVVAGKSIEEATALAVLLEKAARVEILALTVGEVSGSPPEDAVLKREQAYHARALSALWRYYCRKERAGHGTRG